MLGGKHGGDMYQAQFYKIDGLDQTDVGSPVGLAATTTDEAENKALSLSRPEGANFIKILLEGRPVGERLGFAL
jgi:hypothetical protein